MPRRGQGRRKSRDSEAISRTERLVRNVMARATSVADQCRNSMKAFANRVGVDRIPIRARRLIRMNAQVNPGAALSKGAIPQLTGLHHFLIDSGLRRVAATDQHPESARYLPADNADRLVVRRSDIAVATAVSRLGRVVVIFPEFGQHGPQQPGRTGLVQGVVAVPALR